MDKTGGPAFPHPGGSSDSTVQESYLGMTLRDYFAAKAMHAELMTCGVPGEACESLIRAAGKAARDPIAQMAFNAYEMADAMLNARYA